MMIIYTKRGSEHIRARFGFNCGEGGERFTGRCTGEEDLNDDAGEVHVAESLAIELDGAGAAEDEQEDSDDEGEDEVEDAVGEPGEDVQEGVGVAGEDVGDVGAVEDGLEGGEDGDPDVDLGAERHGDVAVREEQDHPCEDR